MSKRSHGPDLGLGNEMQETENHHSIHAGLEQKADDVVLHEHASAHPGQSSPTSTPFVQNRERWVRTKVSWSKYEQEPCAEMVEGDKNQAASMLLVEIQVLREGGGGNVTKGRIWQFRQRKKKSFSAVRLEGNKILKAPSLV